MTFKKALWAALLVLAIIFIIIGVTGGGPQSMLAKAVTICMECVGLG